MNRQKLTVWQGKSILCQKTPQKRLFLCARIRVSWLRKDLDAKRLTPGQLLGWPWKRWSITLQTSFVEGQWHQNWAHTSPLHCYRVCALKFAKSDFWGKTLHTRKFSTGKVFGATTNGTLTHSGFRKCSQLGWPRLRFEVITAQSEAMGQEPVKNQRCNGSKSLCQFSSNRFETNRT